MKLPGISDLNTKYFLNSPHSNHSLLKLSQHDHLLFMTDVIFSKIGSISGCCSQNRHNLKKSRLRSTFYLAHQNDTRHVLPASEQFEVKGSLTVDDFKIDSYFPFIGQRFYHLDSIDAHSELGVGWRHHLFCALIFTKTHITWQNYQTSLFMRPLPSSKYHPSFRKLMNDEIFLGEHENDYVIVLANGAGSYHFHREGNIAKLAAIGDKYGHLHTLHYDKNQRLVSILMADQHKQLLFVYNETCDHLIDSILIQYRFEQEWLAPRTAVQYRYNQSKQLISVINSANQIEYYEYDARNVLTKRILANGVKFSWIWEIKEKITRCRKRTSNLPYFNCEYLWNEHHVLEKIHYLDGYQLVFQHHTDHLQVTEIDALGHSFHVKYNQQGLKTHEIDEKGHETRFTYNQNLQLDTIIYPNQRMASYLWSGNQLSQITVGDRTVKYSYNSLGDLKYRISHTGLKTHYRYNQKGQCIAINSPNGSTLHFDWDRLGQLRGVTYPDGCSVKFTYNSIGQLTHIKDIAGESIQFQYDVMGRVIHVILPNLSFFEYRYHRHGDYNLIDVFDEHDKLTTYKIDPLIGKIIEKTQPDGSVIKWRYDLQHVKIREIQNQFGEKCLLKYTPTGQLHEVIGFDKIRTAYYYDSCGELIEKREYGNQYSLEPLVTLYQRNMMGQLIQKMFADGTKEHYQYDQQGNLFKIFNGKHALIWEYNEENQITAEHQDWATIRHAYDEHTSLLTQTTLPDSRVLYYSYENGQVKTLHCDDLPIFLRPFNHSNSYLKKPHKINKALEFNLNPRLLETISLFTPFNSISIVHEYQDSAQSYLSFFDELSTRQKYHPLHLSITLNPVNSIDLASGNSTCFSAQSNLVDYDRFGNIIREKKSARAKSAINYLYDCRHRLIQAHSDDGVLTTYEYDAFDRCIKKIVNKQSTEFIWHGYQIIAQCALNESHWSTYIYDPDSFLPLASINGNKRNKDKDEVCWYHSNVIDDQNIVNTRNKDQLGDVFLLTHSTILKKYVQKQRHLT